jgi:hypothetical protein
MMAGAWVGAGMDGVLAVVCGVISTVCLVGLVYRADRP